MISCETYVEPFMGSASIFYNLEKFHLTFEKYILNDFNDVSAALTKYDVIEIVGWIEIVAIARIE
jgi:site-specific DNA-adenine methylase